jgi:arylsulfatase A-like enzyme
LRDVPPDWAVVILGDHGEEFGEHAAHAHATTLYQEVLRTPLLLRAPEFPAGRHTETIGCASVPWKSLVAAGILAHAPEPLDFQYAALDIARGEFGYLQDSQLRSVERNGKKLIWSPGLGIWELYDLRADPGETRNLARREPALLLELQGRLTMLSRQCGHLSSAGSH